MDESRTGKCYMMCPLKEIKLREREGLLHKFEIDPSTKNSRRPKADRSRIVKCFNRPAAGRRMPDLTELRPGPVLLMTIRYLFTEVAVKTDCDWVVVYDYIFDRLRAIRQDMVIQQLDIKSSICIYEKIVKFHIYSEQRLCEKPISQYDSKINAQHLIECLEQLITLYDEHEKNPLKVDLDISTNTEEIVYSFDRSKLEALYILIRLCHTKSLIRGLSLPRNIKEAKEVQAAIKIAFASYIKNYALINYLSKELSPLAKIALFCNLRTIRRDALMIMSVAYNSKNLTFSCQKVKELLFYKNVDNLKKDCGLYNLSFKDEGIHFQKMSSNNFMQMANPEMMFSDEEMHKLLPKIILE